NWALTLARQADMEVELRGDVPRAQAAYQKALELQQDVEDHPRNKYYKPVDHQRLKSHYVFKLGETSKRLGDPAAARRLLTQAVELRRAWLTADENSLPARGFLAQATLELADVSGHLGDVKAMHAGFKEGIELVEEILKRREYHDFR